MASNASQELIIQRVLASQLLLAFYGRAVMERKTETATRALRARIRLLAAMREKRGYET